MNDIIEHIDQPLQWVIVKHRLIDNEVDILEVNGPYTKSRAEDLVLSYKGPFNVTMKLLLGVR